MCADGSVPNVVPPAIMQAAAQRRVQKKLRARGAPTFKEWLRAKDGKAELPAVKSQQRAGGKQPSLGRAHTADGGWLGLHGRPAQVRLSRVWLLSRAAPQ